MTGPLATLKNRLLSALPPEDRALLSPHLFTTDLEKGRLLCDPGDPIEQVYFPNDCVISLMTLMENGAAIDASPSLTIGGAIPSASVRPAPDPANPPPANPAPATSYSEPGPTADGSRCVPRTTLLQPWSSATSLT